MRITLLPSAVSGDNGQCQFLTTFLLNDSLALDAGSLGLHASLEQQARVKHILLSHSHIDHLASLPIFLENTYNPGPACPTVHAGAAVQDCLRRDLFNDRVWPDFLNLPSPDAPVVRLSLLEPGRASELEGLRITPVPVHHVVPTFGFIVEDQDAAVVFSSDTGPTDEIWQHANRMRNLKAVFLEVTFPDAMAELADVSQHLTPALFGREVQKLHRQPAVLAVHLKPRFRAVVEREVRALRLPNVTVAQPGVMYEI